MPRRKANRIHVELSEHAKERWIERVGRSPGKLNRLIREILIDQLGAGLIVQQKRVVITLTGKKFRLPFDLMAYLDLPDYRGVWRVITFKPIKGGSDYV